MTAQHFVVTAADGRRDVFANVQNGKGFMAAMIGSGKKVQLASAADLEAAGIGAQLASSGRAGMASLTVMPMRPVASMQSARTRPAAPKPQMSLADHVRKQHGLPLSAEGQAIMAAKAAGKDLKVDIVANMKRRCGVKD